MHSFHIVSVSTRTTKTTLFGFDSQKSKISLNLLVFTFHSSTLRTLAAAGYVWAASDVSAFFFRFFFQFARFGVGSYLCRSGQNTYHFLVFLGREIRFFNPFWPRTNRFLGRGARILPTGDRKTPRKVT